MNLSLLDELKQKVVEEKELARVWEFFLDHFAESDEFIKLGKRARHPLVEAVVEQVGAQLFSNATINSLLLTRLPERHFIHGGFFINGRVGGLFYFEDAQIGLITIAEFSTSEVKFARFSGQQVRRSMEPSAN